MLKLFFKKYLLKLLFVVFMGCISLVAACTPTPEPTPIPESTPTNEPFSYQVRVKARLNDLPVRNATVTIDVEGQLPLTSITDDDGLALFRIDADYADQVGVINVTAPGYQPSTKNKNLVKDSLPEIVILEAMSDEGDKVVEAEATEEIEEVLAEDAPTATVEPTIEIVTTTESQTTPTSEPTITESSGSSDPTPSDTPTPASSSPTPTDEPTPTPTPTPSNPKLTGKIAFSLRFGTENKVYVFEVAPTAPSNPLASISNSHQPVLSANGQFVVVDGLGGGQDGIIRFTSQGLDPQPATCESITAQSGLPTLSPDGQSIAFDGGQVDTNRQIFFHSLGEDCDLSDNRLIISGGTAVNGDGLYPVWGSDNWLYFRSCATWDSNGAGICGLWATQMNGDQFRKVTDNTAHFPTDANDQTLLFMHENGGIWDVYSVDPAGGGTPTNLTRNDSVDVWGTISPDGKSFAFMSNRGGPWAIWIANIDGMNARAWLTIDEQNWGTVDTGQLYAERMSWSR